MGGGQCVSVPGGQSQPQFVSHLVEDATKVYGRIDIALSPGAVLTERTLALDPNYEKKWQAATPTGRVCTLEDVANTVLFIVSPEAAQITGQTFVVDGGWTSTSPTPTFA
jgi:enoyl-[acyl-carrier-protein] reductase (NADH)